VSECGCSPQEFFQALKQDSDGETQLYLEIILAADEYENFILMMRDYKSKWEATRGSLERPGGQQ